VSLFVVSRGRYYFNQKQILPIIMLLENCMILIFWMKMFLLIISINYMNYMLGFDHNLYVTENMILVITNNIWLIIIINTVDIMQ